MAEQTNIDEPFVDARVFPTGNLSWQTYDITPYTSRFPATANAEEAIRSWILRETGAETWHGTQVASLVVSPQRLRVYHEPAVQQKIADLLGRFLYYTPGEFHCRVAVYGATDPDWHLDLAGRLAPTHPGQPANQVWLIERSYGDLLADRLSGKSGKLLGQTEFVVPNGQLASVQFPASSASSANASNAPEGVLVEFSPLIAADAASIDLYADLSVRYTSTGSGSFFDLSGASPSAPKIHEATKRDRLRMAPGQRLLVSMGRFDGLDGASSFLRRRGMELLILVSLDPHETGSQLAERTSSTAPAASRPIDALAPRTSQKPSNPRVPLRMPERLTSPIF